MNFFILEPVAWLISFILSFYMLGAIFTCNFFKSNSWTENFFVNTVLGFAGAIILLIILATFHQLTKINILFVFFLAPVVFILSNVKIKSKQFRIKLFYKGIISHAGFLFFFMYCLLPEAYRIFFPEVTSDSMRYHLPYAKFYAQHSGLAVNEFLRYPLFSHNMDLVFSLGYLFQKGGQAEILARLFHFFSVSLICFGLYSLVARNFNKVSGILACFFLINAKLVHVYSVAGYIDFALGLFMFACIYFIYLWQNDKESKWLMCSAAMLGMALGTKYLALLWLIPMGLWVYATDRNWRNTIRFLVVSILIGSFWYIRNSVISGNPIHPFAQDLFGYWLWTPEDIISQKQDLLVRHGVERSLINLIKLPWILLTEKIFSYDKLSWLVLGIPFMIFAFKMKRFFKIMAVFCLFNLVFWFYSSQILRYFFSILPLLAIFAAYPFGLLYDKLSAFKFFTNKYLIQVMAIALIGFSLYSATNDYVSWNKWRTLPTSSYAWESYLLKTNKDYQFSKILNELKVRRVLKFGRAKLQNTFNGDVLGDWFGRVNMRTIAQQTHSSDELITTMQALKTNYVIVDKNFDLAMKMNDLMENNSGFKRLKESDKSILYQLRQMPLPHKTHEKSSLKN